MKLRPWLTATCSSADCTAAVDSTVPFTPPSSSNQRTSSDTASTSTSMSSSPGTTTTASSSSIQSSLSLQTLPSVPSLQSLTLSPESLQLSVSHCSLTSLHLRGPHPITCLATDGHLLYAASSHIVDVYDAVTLAHLESFNAGGPSSGSVKSVGFSNGKVFTAHQDSKIRVWRLTESKQHRLVTALPTVNDRVRRCILPKNYITVRRHKKLLWIEHADAVTGLAVHEGLVYSISWDKSLKIWSGPNLRCVESVRAHHDAVNAVAVAGDGTVYTGSADRNIRVWAKPPGEKQHGLVATLEKHRSAVNALALSSDGSVLFSGSCDRSILVWEREDSANHMVVTGALRGHDKAILCLINVSDLLLSGSADRTVRIWRRGADGRFCCLAILEGHRKPVKSLVAVSDGKGPIHVFGGSLDGEIKVWQVSSSNLGSPSKWDCI
ncbi:protein JINGUBANG [Punica granatum]|uniref:Uncharacterized protein n=2 Tax=Punica granatum TaxID=22663 RepID=A0A218WTH1_PUNGR|nr:protein JINGUBANG [Punica granatum]OWM76144.1 hypothetical protein CDL15_Pgr009790 [Punica granatum]PKI77096.1 hypothetical protein CRG98_002599 [Punica granatum]